MPIEGITAGIVLLRTYRWHRTAKGLCWHCTAKGLDNDRADTPMGGLNAALPAAIVWNRSSARKENSIAFLA